MIFIAISLWPYILKLEILIFGHNFIIKICQKQILKDQQSFGSAKHNYSCIINFKLYSLPFKSLSGRAVSCFSDCR